MPRKIRPSLKRVMGVAVRVVAALLGFGIHGVEAGEINIKPDQAYSCTSPSRHPDSLNYRIFAKDGTYVFTWSRTKKIRDEISQQRGEPAEVLSLGRWKEIPYAGGGGSVIRLTEDIRYRSSDKAWLLPDRGTIEENVVKSSGGDGFDSKLGSREYFTCVKQNGLTEGMLDYLHDIQPKAMAAKNALTEREANREEANRQQGQNAGQIRQQAIQDRAEAVQAVTNALQLWQRNGKPGSRCNFSGIPTSNNPGEVQVAIKEIQEGDRYMGMNIRGIESTASNLYQGAKIYANGTIEACK